MPVYTHLCEWCGEIEQERAMKDASPTECWLCGRPGLERVYNNYFVPPFDMFQENQNGGHGRWYPQMGTQYLDPHTKTKLNPASHCRSEYEAIERFKAKGCDVSKA